MVTVYSEINDKLYSVLIEWNNKFAQSMNWNYANKVMKTIYNRSTENNYVTPKLFERRKFHSTNVQTEHIKIDSN